MRERSIAWREAPRTAAWRSCESEEGWGGGVGRWVVEGWGEGRVAAPQPANQSTGSNKGGCTGSDKGGAQAVTREVRPNLPIKEVVIGRKIRRSRRLEKREAMAQAATRGPGLCRQAREVAVILTA